MACTEDSNKLELTTDDIITQNDPPAGFSLLQVEDKTMNVSLDPTLTWEESTDPNMDTILYDGYLSDNPNPNELIFQSLSSTNFRIDSHLSHRQKYYWNVVAKDGNGGETNSTTFSFTTRDVRSSLVNENADFSERDFSEVIGFKNKLWLIGGWDYANGLNDIWSSVDGDSWVLEKVNAEFSARLSHEIVEFNNQLWLIGGFIRTGNQVLNDVWRSSDGINWNLVTSNAPFPPRLGHCAVVFKNKIFVIGGRNIDGPSSFNLGDVWSSQDGISWENVTPQNAFAAREVLQLAVLNDKMFLMGGISRDANDFNTVNHWRDIWFTNDGINWEVSNKQLPMFAHKDFGLNNLNGRLWFIGGNSEDFILSDEVWSSLDGEDWIKEEMLEVTYPTGSVSSAVFSNKIWIIAGSTSYPSLQKSNRVWLIE
ncbi:MAG: hypothetical protein AB3N14_13750 [Flavobacteriaceae bacterium]